MIISLLYLLLNPSPIESHCPICLMHQSEDEIQSQIQYQRKSSAISKRSNPLKYKNSCIQPRYCTTYTFQPITFDYEFMRTLTFFQSLGELKFDICMEGSERTQTMLNYNLSVYIKASASIIYQTLLKAWPLFACFNAYSWNPPKLSSNLPGIGILMLCIASQPFLNNWGVNRVSWTGRPYMGPANQQATLCRWRLLQYKYKDREKWNTNTNPILSSIRSPVKVLGKY